MFDRNKTVGFRVRTLSVAIKRAVDASKPQDGCTNTHGWVIGYLYDNRHKDIYQKDIEKQFSVRRPTMTEILKLMEKNGLVVRVKDNNDGRLKKIKLTEKALKIHEQHEKNIEFFENYITQDLTEEELKQIFNTMDKISARVKQAEEEKILREGNI